VIRSQVRSVDVSALLLRKVDYGEADLVLQMLTNSLGRVSVIARSARASKRRFAGGLEPIHGLRVCLDVPEQGDLYRLRESRLDVPRLQLAASLTALTVAGKALSWVRDTTVIGAEESRIFQACTRFLDVLEEAPPMTPIEADARLAEFGLVLLSPLGWALDLERCVRCGRSCPAASPATLDPRQGGLVCRRCGGGAGHPIDPMLRRRMLESCRDNCQSLLPSDARKVLAIVEATLLTHTGIDTT